MAHRQLVEAGLTRSAIALRVERGRLHRVHRGVYLVGHRAEAPLARLAAALLACAPGGVLSHHAAAALWELGAMPAAEIDVTVPPEHRGRRYALRLHRCALPPEAVRRCRSLRVTAPTRTIVDLAAHLPAAQLERTIAEALRRRLTSERLLLAEAGGRRGSRRLRAALDAGPAFTRSEAERRLLGLVRAAALPVPQMNALVAGYEVDVAWLEHRVVVEVDGFAHHGGRDAFERDRRRDLHLHAAGLSVLRLTWRQLTREPELVVARLAAALECAPRERRGAEAAWAAHRGADAGRGGRPDAGADAARAEPPVAEVARPEPRRAAVGRAPPG